MNDLGHGPIKMVNGQLKDDLSRLWCACGEPAVHQDPDQLPQYQFQCVQCSAGWEGKS